jgi:hypothetical protein
LLICYRPKKAEKGRSPPKEEVEAFLAAAENGLARRRDQVSIVRAPELQLFSVRGAPRSRFLKL